MLDPVPDQKTIAEPMLWGRDDAAREIGLTLRSFRRLEAEGKGPPRVLLRGQWRYRPREVRAWVDALGEELDA